MTSPSTSPVGTAPATGVNAAATATAPPVGRTLCTKHCGDLAASGIPEAMAKALEIYSAPEAEVQRLLGRGDSAGAGLVIPYFTIDGEQLRVSRRREDFDFVRVRLDEPQRAAVPGKPQGAKYLSRRGSGQFPYVPPAISRRLQCGAVNTLLMPEGEKKALKAIAEGFDAIGLSGNWGWKTKPSPQLHPMLDALVKPGMTLVIVWDSDAALNTAFAASTRMLH